MRLDILTITLIASLIFTTQTIAVFVQYKVNKSYDGLEWWLLGTVSHALGFLVMPAINSESFWVLSILANPSVVAGQLLLYMGIIKFLGLSKNPWISIATFFVFIAFYFLFIFVADSMSGRAVVVYFATTIISFKTALTLLSEKKKNYSFSANFTAFVFLLYGAFQGAMTLATFFLPPLVSYGDINKTPIRVIIFIVPIVTGMLWTFGFIIMLNQRLNAENLEEKEKWQSIFNMSNDTKFIIRIHDGVLIDVNNGFTMMSGYTREEIIGESILSIDMWDNVEDGKSLKAELEDKGVVKNREIVFRRKDGTRFLGLVSSGITMIQSLPHCVSVVHDISERKEAEQKIHKLLEEKELILKEVHHRIKNNMSTIYSLLSLQAGISSDPKTISVLTEASNRIQSMVMLYDKIYKSPHIRELMTGEYVSPLIDEIIANLVTPADIKIQKHIDDFVLPVNLLQPLGMIINELLTNIVKYAFTGRTNGTITVSATLKENLVTLIVEDDGRGMPESVDFGKSTGFGLVLVNGLTKQMNGTIRIERVDGTKIILEFQK